MDNDADHFGELWLDGDGVNAFVVEQLFGSDRYCDVV